MSVESAVADADGALEAFRRAGTRYSEIDGHRAAVLAEIETLKAELAYWDRRRDIAWQSLIATDTRLCDARDRLRAELRRLNAPELSDVSA